MLCLPNGSQETKDESHLQQDKHEREGKTKYEVCMGRHGGRSGWANSLKCKKMHFRKRKADNVTKSKLL